VLHTYHREWMGGGRTRCSVPECNPTSQQSWEVYDSSMEQVSYTHLEQETEEVEVVVPYNTHTLTIVCTASNSVGKLTERLDITVTRPPSQPQVTGPASIPEDSPGVFLCSVTDPGSPPAEISWSVVNIHGEEVTWSQGTHTQDESQIEVSPSRNDREVTVSCSATNTVSTIQEATKATVTYLPTTITMTAPSSITRGDSLLLHCFTDSSFPSVSLTWSLEGEVETESVLGDSGTTQTHSSLRVVDTTQWETEDNHIQVQCCLETGELCDTRTVDVKGPTPLVLLNLAMTAAENDTENVSDDETNELDQITSELERNEYIRENNAVNFH